MKYLICFFFLSCSAQRKISPNIVYLKTVEINSILDCCVDLKNSQTEKLKFSVSNSGDKIFEFKLTNLVFGNITDSLGNHPKRLVMREPILKSKKRTYSINPGTDELIEIEINFLHQFEYLKDQSYSLKNMYYENRHKKNKAAERILIDDFKISICESK
jgi:hypothetical protein